MESSDESEKEGTILYASWTWGFVSGLIAGYGETS